MKIFLAIWVFAIVLVVSFFGFRGSLTEKPQFIVFPDMDFRINIILKARALSLRMEWQIGKRQLEL